MSNGKNPFHANFNHLFIAKFSRIFYNQNDFIKVQCGANHPFDLTISWDCSCSGCSGCCCCWISETWTFTFNCPKQISNLTILIFIKVYLSLWLSIKFQNMIKTNFYSKSLLTHLSVQKCLIRWQILKNQRSFSASGTIFNWTLGSTSLSSKWPSWSMMEAEAQRIFFFVMK